MPTLIDLYWENVNDYYPLLHRPTFDANLQDGLHLRDEGFGASVLLVCAIGARFSDDPRVSLEEYSNTPHSSGWEWFRQVQLVRKSLLAPPRLYDLQICCVRSIPLYPPFRSPFRFICFLFLVEKNLTESMICCGIYPLIVDRRIFAGILSASGVLDHDWCRHSLGAGCGRSQEESV